MIQRISGQQRWIMNSAISNALIAVPLCSTPGLTARDAQRARWHRLRAAHLNVVREERGWPRDALVGVLLLGERLDERADDVAGVAPLIWGAPDK